MGIAYNTSIVRDGLVLHLDAANVKSYSGSGTVWNDLSGNGNDGTLTNGPLYSAGNNGYFTFDGSNDFISTNNYSLDFGTDSFTLAIWFKTSNNTQRGKIINKGQSGSFPVGAKGYSLRFYDRVRFDVTDGSNSVVVNTVNVNDIPNNTWKYLVGVCDRASGNQLVYIDGIFNNSASITYGSISNPDAELTIGNLERGVYGSDSEFFEIL